MRRPRLVAPRRAPHHSPPPSPTGSGANASPRRATPTLTKQFFASPVLVSWQWSRQLLWVPCKAPPSAKAPPARFRPRRPGTDYPVLARVPYTNFYCDDQRWPGFFADPETRCQTWHYCDIDGRQATFLCPNGTQFSQAVFVCDWWFNVRCDLSRALYAINARLYGPPRPDPTRPHRLITKDLLDNIFV
ncbi:Uncharacterized protein GBIM_01899 [Gryllus bimaculatus]|nr:Uncharacterized protein GBIM_01899 [Gryllus bimaculatus]